MDTLTPSNVYGPGGFKENQYVKTTQYQGVKVFRKVFYWIQLLLQALLTLMKDILKGLAGR